MDRELSNNYIAFIFRVDNREDHNKNLHCRKNHRKSNKSELHKYVHIGRKSGSVNGYVLGTQRHFVLEVSVRCEDCASYFILWIVVLIHKDYRQDQVVDTCRRVPW